jgi:protein TonB
VGGNVQPAKLIWQVKPVIPPDLELKLDTRVLLRGVISTTGELLNIELVNSSASPALAQAVLDAVRQWRYQPTLLNGKPVEVQTEIAVNFDLDQ